MMIYRRMTEKRRAWLEHLAQVGVANRTGRGKVGYHCMHLGWTEWAVKVRETGEVIGEAEAEQRFGVPLSHYAEIVGEMLTDAGRAALTDTPDAGE